MLLKSEFQQVTRTCRFLVDTVADANNRDWCIGITADAANGVWAKCSALQSAHASGPASVSSNNTQTKFPTLVAGLVNSGTVNGALQRAV